MTPQAVDSRVGWRALGPPTLVAGAGIGATVLLHFRDPHQQYSYGVCPFHFVTGLWCPGCGGMRAVNDLTYGDVGAALSSNVLIAPLIVLLGVSWVLWVRKRWRGEKGRMIVVNRKVGTGVLVFLAVFTILRNTPWGSWLAPA